ncbi:MAG: hypothetical protein LC804_07400 [Acidobacteria bacterium]|nr:hypothetical protein [Acidobacteriota bacterium]
MNFIAPKGTVSIRTIDEILLLGPEGNIDVELTPMFRIADAAMVAIDAAKVIGIIRARRTGSVVVSVQASDLDSGIHASRVEFRIE